MSYAEAFWHSVRLQPTMESRLVSSDIKQRLGKKKQISKSSTTSQQSLESGNKLKDFFIRARTLEQMEEFDRLRKLTEARLKDRNFLHKRREERIKKEEISRDKVSQSSIKIASSIGEMDNQEKKIGQAYSIEEMIRDIDEFEKMKEKATKELSTQR